ncbi:MAG TPA: hypothetical protein VE619_11500 [Nitrososphaeraceae archaeon]|nr:hypothetical protein [Nitrososphaeraceae archaeon]
MVTQELEFKHLSIIYEICHIISFKKVKVMKIAFDEIRKREGPNSGFVIVVIRIAATFVFIR